jgi:hypothetical protein
MKIIQPLRSAAKVGVLLVLASCIGVWRSSAIAQPPSQSARATAPIDLTGTWVSIVNEDWRWRMRTPPKGDYASVPMNAEGWKTANTWDNSQEGSCKAYGAAGLMRLPLRVRITWESDDVLRIESDSGQQVRRLHFGSAPPTDGKTRQGRSVATWERTLPPGDGFGFGTLGAQPSGGSLKILTTELLPGWLRKNGVPYSEDARLTEYYDRFAAPDGSEWFVVTTVVEDERYLTQPFITSSHFRKEPEGSRWNPRPCKP